eukprot:TRINITY_DN4047_c0_g1_i3.p1 TRINITY_DN4047_c0_g1~~TRINITY_DN4047_c0_g1_i3.p1  ORF type:complete len:731 (+),score=150.19 TRINITY_DN4047_c0_g1_i3:88-2280(+)
MSRTSLNALTILSLALLFVATESAIISDGPTVVVPATINIGLGGFRGDGAHGFDIFQKISHTPLDARPFYQNVMDLAQHMSDVYPNHVQHCLETEKRLLVQYTMDYSVYYLDPSELRNLEFMIGENMRYVGRELSREDRMSFVDVFEVDIRAVTRYFEVIYANNIYQGKPNFVHNVAAGHRFRPKEAYSIMFLNLDKRIIFESYLQTPNAKATESTRKPIVVTAKNSAPKDYTTLSKSFVYRYRMGEGLSQSWISPGRFIIVDMSSGPVEFGNSDLGLGTVTSESFPSVINPMIYGSVISNVSDVQQIALKLRAQIGSNVVSAIKSVFYPDIQAETIQYSEKILIPFIVFRNHERFNPLKDQGDYYINMDLIKKEVSKLLLPHQEVSFIGGVHSLHDHKGLSLSLSKSIVHESINSISKDGGVVVKRIPYIDSKLLLKSLKEGSDYLTAGLLRNIPDAKEFLQESVNEIGKVELDKILSRGVKILPVYVFSLLHYDNDLLLDQNSLYIANKESVIALQTDSADSDSPYFSQIKQLSLDTRNPTRSIIAGLATSIAGLVPPYSGYSDIHEKLVTDYTWATGYHPFGPFSNSTHIGPIFAENAIRNQIISRIDTARQLIKEAMDNLSSFMKKYVNDPFGEEITSQPKTWIEQVINRQEEGRDSPIPLVVFERLQLDLMEMEREQYDGIANLLHTFQLEEAYTMSAGLVHRATAFRQYVDAELEKASQEMYCW